jgi:hypothetical protein
MDALSVRDGAAMWNQPCGLAWAANEGREAQQFGDRVTTTGVGYAKLLSFPALDAASGSNFAASRSHH